MFFGTIMDCYQTLEVDEDADMVAIRAAYLKRALETHPDKPGGNKDTFQKVVTAFETLSNIAKRCKHGIAMCAKVMHMNRWPAGAGGAGASGQGPCMQGAGVAQAAGVACRDRGAFRKSCGFRGPGLFRSSTASRRGLQGRLLSL